MRVEEREHGEVFKWSLTVPDTAEFQWRELSARETWSPPADSPPGESWLTRDAPERRLGLERWPDLRLLLRA